MFGNKHDCLTAISKFQSSGKNKFQFECYIYPCHVISVPTSIIWHHFHNNISNYLSIFAWKFPWKKDKLCVIFEEKPTTFCLNRSRYRSLRLTILLLRVSMDRRLTYNHNKFIWGSTLGASRRFTFGILKNEFPNDAHTVTFLWNFKEFQSSYIFLFDLRFHFPLEF